MHKQMEFWNESAEQGVTHRCCLARPRHCVDRDGELRFQAALYAGAVPELDGDIDNLAHRRLADDGRKLPARNYPAANEEARVCDRGLREAGANLALDGSELRFS